MRRFGLFAGLLAAGCASAQPAPIAYGSGAPAPAQEALGPTPTPPADEAPDWAAAEGTPLSAYALRREDVQPYDPANPPRNHRVGADESLYDIATAYQVPLLALIDQNGLQPPYVLTPGSELQLPPPRIHTVARGESFDDIARRYNIDPRSLALLNRMQPPYRVRAGDRIVLPAMARPLAPAPGSPPAATEAAASTVPETRAGRFVMPLRGEITARFGAQPGGASVDGLEIAGREGARVVAAAEGDVVYAGSDLAAYGALVLIRHADNYVTAYGYNRRTLVREGDHVAAGAPIAELGARADGPPRLLFQVRRGSAAVDPAPLLGLRS